MSESEKTKATTKEWIIFIVQVLVVFGCGFCWGFGVGRNHPSSTAKMQYLEGVREEVRQLHNTYIEIVEEYKVHQQIQDSIIYTLKREIANGGNVDFSIVVNVNLTEDDNDK